MKKCMQGSKPAFSAGASSAGSNLRNATFGVALVSLEFHWHTIIFSPI